MAIETIETIDKLTSYWKRQWQTNVKDGLDKNVANALVERRPEAVPTYWFREK